jgi:Uma2 family endonuclease
MLAPTKHRFNVKEYYRMAETGVLRPDARVELLNGEIIDMSPIGPFHGGVTNYLNEVFTRASKGRWMTSVQNPVHLDDYSEPQPDLVLLKPSSDFYRKRHPQPEDVYLLVEVSESSLATDREEKLPAYGRAGISELWIVNLIDQSVEVYREPHFAGYSSKTVLGAGGEAKPLAFPDVIVDVTELLKR